MIFVFLLRDFLSLFEFWLVIHLYFVGLFPTALLPAADQSLVDTFLGAHSDLVPPPAKLPRGFRASGFATLLRMLHLIRSADLDDVPWEDKAVDVDGLPWGIKAEILDCLYTLRLLNFSGSWLERAISDLEDLRPHLRITGSICNCAVPLCLLAFGSFRPSWSRLLRS